MNTWDLSNKEGLTEFAISDDDADLLNFLRCGDAIAARMIRRVPASPKSLAVATLT